jgi:Clp amino terminal domain, pathogenicity island component
MDIDLDTLVDNVAEASDDPLDRITTAVLLQEQLAQLGDDLLDHFVKEARDAGCSWAQIGEALGVTRQAAQQRHGGFIDRMLGGLLDGRFRRFTPRAREAVKAAQEAARSRNHDTIGTEHLLLGLYAVGDQAVAAIALGRLGLDAATVDRLVTEREPDGATPVKGHVRFSPGAKKALQGTVQQALALNHNYVGTEHMALALRQVPDGTAARIMEDAGVSYDDLKAQVVISLREVSGGKS